MTADLDMLRVERDRLLEAAERLEEEIGDIAHEERRVADALERTGGRGHDLHRRRIALREARRLNEADLGRTSRRLAEIERALERPDGGE